MPSLQTVFISINLILSLQETREAGAPVPSIEEEFRSPAAKSGRNAAESGHNVGLWFLVQGFLHPTKVMVLSSYKCSVETSV